MYIFKLACGCTLKRTECEEIMYTDAVTKKWYHRLGCAKHMCAERLEVIFVCECCGVEEVNPYKVTNRRYCVDCAKGLARKRSRESNRLRDSFVNDQTEIEVKPDCEWYLTRCLPKAARVPLDKGRVKCKGCIRYRPQELDILDYVDCRSDVFEDARNDFGLRRGDDA